MHITKDGAFYRRYMPHYRSPGCIYHCRFSLNPSGQGFRFTEDWMFAIVESAILADHKKECMIHAYVVMADHAHAVLQPLPKVNDPFAWCDCHLFYPRGRRCVRPVRCASGLKPGPTWPPEKCRNSRSRLAAGTYSRAEVSDFCHFFHSFAARPGSMPVGKTAGWSLENQRPTRTRSPRQRESQE